MKLAILALAAAAALPAAADTYVNGYFRSDGTYVQPHYRSDANGSRLDNYSTRGNINPYTGKRGTVDPFAPRHDSFNSPYGNHSYSYGRPYGSYNNSFDRDDSYRLKPLDPFDE